MEKTLEMESQVKASVPVLSSRARERTKVTRQEKVEVRAATFARFVRKNQLKAATTRGRKSRSQVYWMSMSNMFV
ncbi:MAG: hypothetical protein ACLU7D_08185 [Collinsella sp.]